MGKVRSMANQPHPTAGEAISALQAQVHQQVPTAQPGPCLMTRGGTLPWGTWAAPAFPCH